MKKQHIKSLELNKKVISKIEDIEKIKGGYIHSWRTRCSLCQTYNCP